MFESSSLLSSEAMSESILAKTSAILKILDEEEMLIEKKVKRKKRKEKQKFVDIHDEGHKLLDEMFEAKTKASQSEECSGSQSKCEMENCKQRSNRSRSRSKSRNGKSKRGKARSRSRSIENSKRRSYNRTRSRSRNRSRRGNRSRSKERRYSRSRSRSYDKSRSQNWSDCSRLEGNDVEKNVFNQREGFSRKKSIAIKMPEDFVEKNVSTSVYGRWEKYEHPSNCDIDKLTKLCQDISAKENESTEEKEWKHPFAVTPAPMLPPTATYSHRNRVAMNPGQAILDGTLHSITGGEKTPTGPLESYFPVSSGSEHRELEGHKGRDLPVYNVAEEEEPINVSAVVARRLGAQQILAINPLDESAKSVLEASDLELKKWSERNKKPGKFTGGQLGTLMNKQEIAGTFETWLRKDFFQNLQPVVGGIGMRMMQKMGWQEGKPLGKSQEGYLNPITVDVKVGRAGLYSADEQPQYNHWNGKLVPKRKPPAPITNVGGKHPVSALAELCTRKRWDIPEYTCVFERGQSHNKNFLMKVRIGTTDYQSTVASPNKKHAKACAALVALEILEKVT